MTALASKIVKLSEVAAWTAADHVGSTVVSGKRFWRSGNRPLYSGTFSKSCSFAEKAVAVIEPIGMD